MKSIGYFVKKLFISMCLFGNLSQLVDLFNIYFKYDVFTIVMVGYSNRFRLPDVSKCYHIIGLVKWEKLQAKYPSIVDRLNFTQGNESMMVKQLHPKKEAERVAMSLKLIKDMSYSDLEEVTLGVDEMFFGCGYEFPNVTRSQLPKCNTFFVPSTFYKEAFKCFHFPLRNHEHEFHDYRRTSRSFLFPAAFFTTGLSLRHKDKISRFYSTTSFLSDPNYIRRDGILNPVLNLNITMTNTFLYIEYQNTLLPWPYTSDCRDYRKEEYLKKANLSCYDYCSIEKSIQQLNGSIIPGPKITSYEKFAKYKMTGYSGDEVTMDSFGLDLEIWSIHDYCDKKCKKDDCLQKFYFPYRRHSVYIPFAVMYIWYFPSLPSIKTEYRPKLDFLTFITSFASTFGFWFGISIAQFDDTLVEGFNMVKGEKKDRKPESGIPEENRSGRPVNSMKLDSKTKRFIENITDTLVAIHEMDVRRMILSQMICNSYGRRQ